MNHHIVVALADSLLRDQQDVEATGLENHHEVRIHRYELIKQRSGLLRSVLSWRLITVSPG